MGSLSPPTYRPDLMPAPELSMNTRPRTNHRLPRPLITGLILLLMSGTLPSALPTQGAPGAAQAVPEPSTPRAGVYGWIRNVTLDPNDVNPERIQVWGIFSVAADRDGQSYHAPERGYLYFSLPEAGADAARTEWLELRRQPRRGGLWSFHRPGGTIRVRTSDEIPQQPDPYIAGNGITPSTYDASPGARMMGAISHEGPTVSYAAIDRVVLSPSPDAPARVQILGAFVMAKPPSGGPYEPWQIGYQPLQRGYLYFTLPSNPQRATQVLAQWNTLLGAAGTSDLAAIGVDGRVRPMDEAPANPDVFDGNLEFFVTRTNSSYAPIRELVDR